MEVLTEVDDARIRSLLERDEFFWLDLHAPDAGDFARVGQILGLHAMAMEDGPGIPFLEIYLGTPNDSSSQYEPPEHPEVALAEKVGIDERVNRVLEHLMRQIR